MIRFCDLEAYAIKKTDMNRGQLFGFFCQKQHLNDIVIVYDENDEFIGIITYDRLLSGNPDMIQKERVYINDDLWSNAKNILNEHPEIEYLPVFTETNQFAYVCYNDESGGQSYFLVEQSFEQFEQNSEYLFIKDFYPHVQVICLYDMNEFAFRLYKLLKRNGYHVEVHGEKWKVVCGIENEDDSVNFPDYAKMNIFAEQMELSYLKKDRNSKNKYRAVASFNFLWEIIFVNRMKIQYAMREKFRAKGIHFYLCSIPTFEELSHYTLEEFYRKQNKICFNNLKNFRENKLSYNQYKKVQGEKKYDPNGKKDYTEINLLNGMNFKARRYGDGINYIYVLGPCIVGEYPINSDEKLPYFLHKYMKEKFGNLYSIITISLPIYKAFQYKNLLESLSIRENDIIFCIDEISIPMNQYNFINDPDINLKSFIDSRPENENWFFYSPVHSNKIGNMRFAKELVDNYFSKYIEMIDFNKKQTWLNKGNILLSDDYRNELHKYISSIAKFEINCTDKIGAIVMNCNPFTLGHKYLIEQAVKKVDYLYVFVVEEKQSEFPFEDRINLVRSVNSIHTNIKVVPSGRFIISSETMPIYFEKAIKQDEIVDALKDIEIFGCFIAKELNITVRFAGEEPLDNITRQYNQEMKRTLSKYDIEFVEIPRIQNNGEVISASRVRRLLKSKNWVEIEKIVPIETYHYLKKRFDDSDNISNQDDIKELKS